MEKLLGYSRSRFKSLTKLLEKSKEGLNPQSIHRIRLELKKIKSVYCLLDFCVRRFNYSREYKPLRKMFRKAGDIRDYDVLHQLYVRYKIRNYSKNISEKTNKKNKRMAAFSQNAEGYIMDAEKQERRIKKYFKEFSSRDLEDYFLRIENKLSAKLFPQFREDDLHGLRKHCKEIIYLSEAGKDKKQLVRIKLYDKLQDIIGQWHDKRVLIDSLLKSKDDSYKKVIIKLKTDCINDIKKINP